MKKMAFLTILFAFAGLFLLSASTQPEAVGSFFGLVTEDTLINWGWTLCLVSIAMVLIMLGIAWIICIHDHKQFITIKQRRRS